MADVTHDIMIRFGLSRRPTQVEIDAWVQLTDALIRQGMPAKDAGLQAAYKTLPGPGTKVFATQADTIEMLLSKAKEK